jgi:hypothetical protein
MGLNSAALLFFVLVASFHASFCDAARRWRFAVPFPGRVEPSFPGGEGTRQKNAFADMDKQEKIFDTKEVSRQEHKPKVVLGDHHVNEKNQKNKKKRSGFMVTAPEEHKLSPIEIIDSSHMPWIL